MFPKVLTGILLLAFHITLTFCIDGQHFGQSSYFSNILFSNITNYPVVTKTVKNPADVGVILREVCVLKILQRFEWCPRLLNYTETTIQMSFVGKPVSPDNIPDNYAEQYTQILRDMESVGVKHSDIVVLKGNGKKIEIMVSSDNHLSLIDFNWATVNDNVPCQTTKFSYPSGLPLDDSSVLEVLHKMKSGLTLKSQSDLALKSQKSGFRNLNSQNADYRDKARQVGSQKEVPSFSQDGDMLKIRGYQDYDLTPNGVVILKKQYKFNYIKKQLMGTKAHTFMDMGCNAGESSFIARQVGFDQVYSLDHDSEYIGMMKKVVALRGESEHMHPQVLSFGDALPLNPDVLFVGALIHWVYSCTAHHLSFAPILKYLSVAPMLFIEWIDPEDVAMRNFNHLKCGNTTHTEDYTVENFERAVNEIGHIIFRHAIDTNTRVLYKIKVNTVRQVKV